MPAWCHQICNGVLGDYKGLLKASVRVAYECNPLLGCVSMHGINYHRGHGVISDSSHEN
jgi:hypothetical protein